MCKGLEVRESAGGTGGKGEGVEERKLLNDFEVARGVGFRLGEGGRVVFEGRGESMEVVVEGAGEWWRVVEDEVTESSVSDMESSGGEGARRCSKGAVAEVEARCRDRIVCVM